MFGVFRDVWGCSAVWGCLGLRVRGSGLWSIVVLRALGYCDVRSLGVFFQHPSLWASSGVGIESGMENATLNPKPQTPNPKPQTPNPKP